MSPIVFLRTCCLVVCMLFAPFLVFPSYGQDTLSALGNMHRVAKGETWESVAAVCGVSVPELQAANPDVRRDKLKKGTLLIVPARKASSADVRAEQSQPESASVIRTALPHLKVGVLLPMAEKRMVEFYRGLLMAADSVRRSGVSLDIHAWNSGATAEKLEPVLAEMKGFDLIFGSPSATQVPALCELCREQGTRLVLPFRCGMPLEGYPLVYEAMPSDFVFCDATVRKMLSYYPDRNYVVVRCADSTSRGKILCESLARQLAQKSAAPKYVNLDDDDDAYAAALSLSHDNMILLDGSSLRSMNILTARLKDFRRTYPSYRLSLVGYPEWQEGTDRLLGDFFSLDTYIASPYYYNVLDTRTKGFQRTYEKNFRSAVLPDNPRCAALGFDLGYFFMSGLSSLGDTFEQMQGNVRQEPYQSWLRFERNGTGLNLVNRFVLFVHYTSEERIELIR